MVFSKKRCPVPNGKQRERILSQVFPFTSICSRCVCINNAWKKSKITVATSSTDNTNQSSVVRWYTTKTKYTLPFCSHAKNIKVFQKSAQNYRKRYTEWEYVCWWTLCKNFNNALWLFILKAKFCEKRKIS